MQLNASDISIAVTMYRRLDYLEQALDSAVGQTVPVTVRLYDDGCQDADGLKRLLAKYGESVEYHRNPRTLGLFQNMNQCLEKAPTPWVSILHDDDALEPVFVEQILSTAPHVEHCALFFGRTLYMNSTGAVFHRVSSDVSTPWRLLRGREYAWRNWFPFPGQLVNAAAARAAGGFPEKSIYTGDWELWFQLARRHGAVEIAADLARHRAHLGGDRGTTASAKTGRKMACCAMQVKRNLARLRQDGDRTATFDRARWLKACTPLFRDLLVYAWRMPAWLLRYNRALLHQADPKGRASRALLLVSRALGNPGIRLAGLARSTLERLGIRTPQTF